MILEVGIDELINIYQGIRFCLNTGSPIKRPLINTEEQIKELLEEYNSSKNEIADKYLVKDEKGSPIQKDSSTAPELMTDYMSNDEEEMVKALDKLGEHIFKLDIDKVSPSRPVLVTKENEVTTEYTLEDFLELSGSVDSKVVVFLNKYFIND